MEVVKNTSKIGLCVRDLVDLLFTAYKLETCFVKGHKKASGAVRP